MDRKTVSRWANRFRGDCLSIDNDSRPERSRTSTNERSVKLVADAFEDLSATCEDLSRATGVPATSVFRILSNDLRKRKIPVLWVPHCLRSEEKKKRMDIETLLKERFDFEN